MEQQSQPKRGRGRPPKQTEIKRTFFQTRMRESQRRRLEAAAAENGRSLSEEIELRLELSLRDNDIVDQLTQLLTQIDQRLDSIETRLSQDRAGGP